jgi:hypothetical protein
VVTLAEGFTLSATHVGPRRWIQVRVHPNSDHLVVAADRLAPHHGLGWWEDCRGCFQPARYRIVQGQVVQAPNGYAGILRLAKGWITPEIVAHELVHAACQIYRMNVKAELRLSNGCGEREEQFAYIYGELAGAMQGKLSEHSLL